jgi:L-amino acid N-acyltransferase YncA
LTHDVSGLIRIAGERDARAIAGIYAPAITDAVISFELTAPDTQEMLRRVVAIQRQYPWLVYEESKTVLGYVYASVHNERAAYRWSVDVTAYIRHDAHRRGMGRALYTALFEILVLQGYRTACAGITLPNIASVRMHAAMGFKEVGVYHDVGYKFGKWHDVGWYELSLAAHVPEPPEPVPFPELAGSPAVKAAFARATGLIKST